MNVTATGVGVALAVVVALAFLFFGPAIFTPFTPHTTAAVEDTQATSTTMQDQTSGAQGAPAGAADTTSTQTTATGLGITDTVVGTGAEAKAGDSVTVNYVGMLTDGTVFDASAKHGQAFTFNLGGHQVIAGWDEGVAGMKEGGTRKLVIPASLAYGDQGVANVIPGGATLIFEVQLVKVQAGK